jgi:hypothetical protein
MSRERQRWQALEIKHNVIALGPIELLNFANSPSVPHERLHARLIQSALLAKLAYEATDTEPDLAFKIMETEFLGRVERDIKRQALR